MNFHGMLQFGFITRQQYQRTFASFITITFHHGIFHDIVTLVNLKLSCFISKTLHVQRTDHVDTHSPRCPKVLWPRRFLWHVSPTEKNRATRRGAIHAFDLSIEDDLGTTEVAKGNQCPSSSGVGKKDESGNRGFAFAPCFCWQFVKFYIPPEVLKMEGKLGIVFSMFVSS